MRSSEIPLRSSVALAELNGALNKGANVYNGTLWLCFIDRINPLSRENVETMMSQYDRESPQTLYDLAQNAGLDVGGISRDWLLRDVYPDYREVPDSTAQAVNDIYGECRLFLLRDLKSSHQADAPFGIRVTERFFIRSSTRGLELTETIRKLHEHIVHPQLVKAGQKGIPVRIFAANHPGFRPSVELSAA